jgi:hypothetical protein
MSNFRNRFCVKISEKMEVDNEKIKLLSAILFFKKNKF